MSAAPATRATYGIDAPGIAWALTGIGGAALIADVTLQAIGGLPPWLWSITANTIPSGVIMLLIGLWMIWSSLFGKQRLVRRMIGELDLRGDERVLDIGCGRGLAAIEAAKRLTGGGTVTGIDLWQGKDLSGNGPAAAEANAAAEGVAARIGFDTGDARALPYADASFDAIVSMTALHNIPNAKGREQALAEALRVLKLGGKLAISDIVRPPAYVKLLRKLGAKEVQLSHFTLLWLMPGWQVSAKR